MAAGTRVIVGSASANRDERVFADSHALVLDWVTSGLLDGLRVDHPDGLHDPARYCRRLRRGAIAWLDRDLQRPPLPAGPLRPLA